MRRTDSRAGVRLGRLSASRGTMKRRARVRSSLVVLALAAWTGAPGAWAEDEPELEDVVQEVFLGQLAFPQDALELQVSAGSSWVEADGARVLAPLIVVELGLTDRLQIEVEAPFVVAIPSKGDAGGGPGNVELGALYNVARSPLLGLLISAGVAAMLPTASTDLIGRAYGAAAVVAAYKTMGAVHANLSAESGVEVATGGEEEAEMVREVALSLLVPLGALTPIAEIGFEREGEENAIALAGGLAWHGSGPLEIGLAGLMRNGEGAAEWGAVVNFTWEGSLTTDRD
jgi:hypothetical protein